MTKNSLKTKRFKYHILKLEHDHEINMFKLKMENEYMKTKKTCLVFVSVFVMIMTLERVITIFFCN